MIVDQVNILLEKFYKNFNEVEELSLKQFMKNVTKTELHVIEAIGIESITMNGLSDKLGITMGTATVAINKLMKKGFIERKRCEEDRRKVFVSLSVDGLKAFEYHTRFHKEIISVILSDLNNGELEKFVEVFRKIQNNLDNQLEGIRPTVLNKLLKNDSFKIIEIKGTPGVKDFFISKNLKNNSNGKIIQNNLDEITIEIDGVVEKINNADAKNVIVVKKS